MKYVIIIGTKEIKYEVIKKDNSDFLKKLFWNFQDTKGWTLNFGISVPIVVAYSGATKNPKFIGYIQYTTLSYQPEILKAKIDITSRIKNKLPILIKLISLFKSEVKKIKNLTTFRMENATKEGERLGRLLSKKLGLKFEMKR